MELCDSLSTIFSLLYAYESQYLLRWKTNPEDSAESNTHLKTVLRYVILLYHIPYIFEGSTNDLFTSLNTYMQINK